MAAGYRDWRSGIYDEIRGMMQLQGKLPVERMCQLAGVSRAGFYRHLVEVEPDQEEMELRDAIQRIYLGHRRNYGHRRITAELRHRGMLVNRKRVARLMREDNPIAVRQRKYVVTTDSEHDLQVYLNLAARMDVTAVNQLRVADNSLGTGDVPNIGRSHPGGCDHRRVGGMTGARYSAGSP